MPASDDTLIQDRAVSKPEDADVTGQFD